MARQALRALAARQYGLAHRRQLPTSGVREEEYRHLLRRGDWRHLTPTVIELVGSPNSVEKRLMLATLDLGLGAVLSHHSAAACWQLPGFAHEPVHVMGSRERGRRKSRLLGIVHQPSRLDREHVLRWNGIPITTPTRTLFDLAGVLHPGRVERALDSALAARVTTVPLLHSMLKDLACRGRPGIRLMRSLLADRPPGYVPPASGLESRFQHVARRAGFWTLERQVNVGSEYDWIGRVDFLDRSKRLIVEVQSERFHQSISDRERDRRRIARLRAAGWRVLEVHEHDLWHNPDKVVYDLRRAFS